MAEEKLNVEGLICGTRMQSKMVQIKLWHRGNRVESFLMAVKFGNFAAMESTQHLFIRNLRLESE